MNLHNKIIKCLAAGTMLLAMACTNLDVEVESQLTNENFPRTDEDYASIAGPVYSECKDVWRRGTWHLQSQTSDESALVAGDGGWYDGGRYMDLHKHTWNSDNGWVNDVYKKGFKAISTTNRVIGMLEETPDSPEKDKGMAELRVMRAFYMFLATDNFGAIPIIEKFGEDKQYDRVPRKQVVEFIESEILAALPYLSRDVDLSTYNRPTYYMAKALLAKLYINWNVYAGTSRNQDVVAVCDDIIRDGKFQLEADYIAMFKPDNGPHIKEFIFVVPFDGQQITGNDRARYWLHKILRDKFEMPYGPSGPVRAMPEVAERFTLENDIRNDIFLKGPQYNNDGTPIIINTTKNGLDRLTYPADHPEANQDTAWHLTFTKEVPLRGELMGNGWQFDVGKDELGKALGWRCNKIYADKNGGGSRGRDQNNDIPVFRFADILLLKAEAILRGANATEGDTPESLINQIRNRAGAPAVAALTLDELLDERGREFFDENWRRNDLIRYGKWGEAWTHKPASDASKIIFPIPTNELLLNPNWEQNPGY